MFACVRTCVCVCVFCRPVTVSIYAYSGLLSDNKKNNQQPFVSGPDPSAAFRPIPDYNTDSSGPGPSGTGFAPSEPSPLRPLPDPNAGGGGGEVPGPSTPDDPFRPLPDPNTGGSEVPSSPDGSQSLPPMITVQTPDFMQIVSLDMSQVDIAACQVRCCVVMCVVLCMHMALCMVVVLCMHMVRPHMKGGYAHMRPFLHATVAGSSGTQAYERDCVYVSARSAGGK